MKKDEEGIEKITFDKTEIRIPVGGTEKIKAKVSPDGDISNLTWKSSNKNVAVVEDGIVVGISDGIAVIFAESENGKYAYCVVAVGDANVVNIPETPETPADPGTGNNPDVPPVTENNYSLGMGLVFGEITSSQINATIATVVLDENGVIVACKIDAIYNKYSITADGIEFTSLLTKKELGYDYNMAKYGYSLVGNDKVLEWFEQAAAFEAWCVGKTIAQVAAMETQTMENGFVISADDDLLNAGCTIQIGDFVAAVVKAGNDDQAMSFMANGTITLGLGVNNADNGSAGDDFEATVNMNSDFAAVVLVDGKIVAALNDATQPQVKVEDGSVVSADVGKKDADGNSLGLLTKRELKEGYNMAVYSIDNNGDGIVLEWYLQSAAFSNYIVGMTLDEVAGLKTQLVNDHYISADADLLSAGCTIQITGIKAVVAEAANDAQK